jgi:hypothetical protein
LEGSDDYLFDVPVQKAGQEICGDEREADGEGETVEKLHYFDTSAQNETRKTCAVGYFVSA